MADYIDAHAYTINHCAQLLHDKKCGCFYCLKLFSPMRLQTGLKTRAVRQFINEYPSSPVSIHSKIVIFI